MLSSLEISDFRTFRHLRIERLGRVNLIVGKNNVGKTTLLEALHVYVAENPRVVLEDLEDHDEFILSGVLGDAYLDYRSLFHGRQSAEGKAFLGPVDGVGPKGELKLELVPMERVEDSEGRVTFSEISPTDSDREGETVEGLGFRRDGGPGLSCPPRKSRQRWRQLESAVCYIRARGIQSEMLWRWWDSIAGTEHEREVIDSLRVIAPFELVRLVGDPAGHPGRLFLVRMQGQTAPVPLCSLGGGAERMFQYATAVAYLAHVLSKEQRAESTLPEDSREVFRQVLLIDEIENGIHHTLHADLWRFILRFAALHDLQVFATTHSHDCLIGFAQALADDEQADGQVVRLERSEGEEATRAVVISREKLPIVARDAIEVR